MKALQSLVILISFFSLSLTAGQTVRTFDLSSINVLGENNYVKNYSGASGRMALGTRIPLFTNFIQALRGNNVVVAQEFDDNFIQGLRNLPQQPQALFNQPSQPGLTTLLRGQHFGMTGSRTYTRFKTAGAGKPDKGFQVTRLIPRDTAGKQRPDYSVGILNVHITGGPGPQGNYNKFRIDQVRELANYLKAHRADNRYWIIAGDFNTDSRTNAPLVNQFLNVLNTSGIQFSDAVQTPYNVRQSAYEKGKAENVDYIFYSNNLNRVHASTMNTDLSGYALTHGHGTGTDGKEGAKRDAARNHFSDHAVVLAQFSITIPASATAKKAPAKKQAAKPAKKAIPQLAKIRAVQKIAAKKRVVAKPVAKPAAKKKVLPKKVVVAKKKPVAKPIKKPVVPAPKRKVRK